ncbi:MAG TPA: hypothetical protein VNM92_07125 [Thermoanaerobaculia bacterium]|nr:hypothetical protein [Thermoanaerobaculia bacterium]
MKIRRLITGPAWRRTVLSLYLLLDRRAVTFLIIDVMMLLTFITAALLGEGDAKAIYFIVVLVPFMVLGLPVLSDTVALERRAGSLDLALSTPGSDHYFDRRIGSFCALMFVQGAGALVVARFTLDAFPLWPALIQLALSCGLIGTTVLFWSLRLRTVGAVLFAAIITFVLLGKWLFSSPVYPHWLQREPAEVLVGWAANNGVILFTAILFYLYSRRRLGKPELLLQ